MLLQCQLPGTADAECTIPLEYSTSTDSYSKVDVQISIDDMVSPYGKDTDSFLTVTVRRDRSPDFVPSVLDGDLDAMMFRFSK